MDSNKAGVTLFVGGAFALVFLVLGILYIETLPEPSELLALRLELDLNMARGEGFQEGYAYAQFLCQGDVNALRQACQQELGAIVAECNSRLEACEK